VECPGTVNDQSARERMRTKRIAIPVRFRILVVVFIAGVFKVISLSDATGWRIP